MLGQNVLRQKKTDTVALRTSLVSKLSETPNIDVLVMTYSVLVYCIKLQKEMQIPHIR